VAGELTELFEPIAVVGFAARFPGSRDVDEFWRNLKDGRDCITRLTDAELLAAGETPDRVGDPSYVKAAGLLPDVADFDAEFFGMSPQDAEMCDPQLRMMLELVHTAVEDAGYATEGLGRDVAVFAASGPSSYATVNLLPNPRYPAGMDLRMSVLNNVDYLATLVSYKFDFHGPSMSVLSACSSSLSALQLACQSLQLGQCDTAVAGACNVELPYARGYRWSPGDVRSADGHCRPFDASASGTIFTNGGAAVILRRLSDAIADGDDVRGILRGIGLTNDGSVKVSFSAPSVSGQARAITDAMALAGIEPAAVSFVEMHATGTALGDPVEVAALAAAYRQAGGDRLPLGSIPVGSVKSNIGHTVAASGMAGLLKVLLALRHEELPPTANLGTLNPRLELERTPFVVPTTVLPWPRRAGSRRVAAVTSLGIGGTNAHLVLEEGPAPCPTPTLGRPRVVVWSGKDADAEEVARTRLAEHFGRLDEAMLADTAATLQQGRTHHPHRAALVCGGTGEAAAALADGRRVLRGTASEPPRVAFAFGDEEDAGTVLPAEAYGVHQVFTETVDVCLDAFAGQGVDLYPQWTGERGATHPIALYFTAAYATARQLLDWGVRPACLVGDGAGRLVALTVAGVLPVEEAVARVLGGDDVDLPEPDAAEPPVRDAPDPDVDLVVRVGSGPPTLGGTDDADNPGLLGTLAALWTMGCPVDWGRVYPDEPLQRVPAPGYPLRRTRHWVEPARVDAPRMPAAPVALSPFRLPGWREPDQVDGASPGLPPGTHCLALLPADPAAAADCRAVLDVLGVTATEVVPGPVFAASGAAFTVRPDHLGNDLDAVMRSLLADGSGPALVLHAWGCGQTVSALPDPPDSPDGELDTTVLALVTLVQRAARYPVAGRLPTVAVLTGSAVDVAGGETVSPTRAALVAMVRSLALESPGQTCRLVDRGAGVPAHLVAAELLRTADDPVVALRGRRRWVYAEREFRPGPADRPVVRDEGTYLVTGGLGGLGQVVARALAASGRRPRLALLGRQANGDSAAVRRLEADLQAQGARVLVLPCDVADEAALESTLQVVSGRFGPLDGVFHLAGVAGESMVQTTDEAAVRRVLRAKTAGTLALLRCLRRRGVDRVVCFSSRSAVTGMVGGADYAAANAFTDAVAAATPGWLSIDWPAWAGVGMVADGRLDALTARMASMTAGSSDGSAWMDDVVSAASSWELDEHRIAGVPVLPGTAVADLVVRAGRTQWTAAGMRITVRDLVFRRPLAGAEPRRIRAVARENRDGVHRVRVVSGPPEGRGPWVEHARCTAVADTAAPPPPVDLESIRAGMTPAPAPRLREAAGMALGMHWDVARRVWHAPDEALVELQLPAPFAAEADAYALHPALLDVATGLLGGPATLGPGAEGLFAPFMYRSLAWYRPLPAHCWSHLRVRHRSERSLVVDVTIAGADGTVAAVVEGLRMQWAALADFAAGRAAATTRPVSVPPEEGVRLLQQLLACGATGQVHVVPIAVTPAVPAPLRVDPADASDPAGPAARDTDVTVDPDDVIRAVWTEILGRDVEPDSDFFDLDGDSLSAVALVGRIRDEFQLELSVGAVFDHPTLREFQALVVGHLAGSDDMVAVGPA
jgi:acyl transferase domain-containing protein/acyl carrier protein